MTKIDTYNQSGEKAAQIELNAKIFNAKVNNDLIYQAVLTQLNNARNSNAHTKTRGEVAGSGIKPWKQKGTGRARIGDIRAPHWIGGGVIFGPRNTKNYSKKFPKKMRKAALAMALSQRAQEKRIIVLNNLELKNIKTADAQKLLAKLPVTEGTILIIAESNKNNILSFRNLPYVKLINESNINIYDILKFNWIVFTAESLKKLESQFTGAKEVAKDSTSTKKSVSDKPVKTVEKKAKNPSADGKKTTKTEK